ncbi:MAG: hypothetical protein ACO20F_11775 [Robiginitalea sp.]
MDPDSYREASRRICKKEAGRPTKVRQIFGGGERAGVLARIIKSAG